MFIQLKDSKQFKKFLKDSGIVFQKGSSALNAVRLKNTKTGEEITLWAESDSSIACGIPGIFVDEE